ncbi:MAG: glycosyl hydrolase [Epsilonproteobacteria bacterium]|nr:glycosyl hydrolase [Campylobacterota bacterium]
MHAPKEIFVWDHYSDQPYPIKDKKAKKRIQKYLIWDSLKMLITDLVMLPFISIRYFLPMKQATVTTKEFFALGINVDKEPEITSVLVKELGVQRLIIRVPLADSNNIKIYKNFIDQFSEYDILVNIIQDREHIENPVLLKKAITMLFETLNINEYQVGHVINRKKWGFFTVDEYLDFYHIVQKIRDTKFPHIKLIGSSVIDFEYHYTIRTLFHFTKLKYDTFSTLLYVDRRGSPENRQIGLDLIKKIKLLTAIIALSPKSNNRLYITETNWPISNTAPYAPTSEKECVDLDSYALFMVQYYLMALSTGMVERVYWHQLIAPGYGLVDNRSEIKKYPAYEAYKTMVMLLKDATLNTFDFTSDIKYMQFKSDTIIEVFWSTHRVLKKPDFGKIVNIYGHSYKNENFMYVLK